MIARDQWFDSTVYVHSHCQKSSYKEDEQKSVSDSDVSVSSVKTRVWIRLQMSFYGFKQVTKKRSHLREIMMMESGTTINLFENTNIITNRLKADIPMNFLTNPGSKIVSEVGQIPGSGQKQFHPEMISNILSVN